MLTLGDIVRLAAIVMEAERELTLAVHKRIERLDQKRDVEIRRSQLAPVPMVWFDPPASEN